MLHIPDAFPTDPATWRIAMKASAVTLSMNDAGGPRLLYELHHFEGPFYLRPSGLLAGFSLRIPLPPRPRGGERPALLWETADLEPDETPNRVGGRGRLRLGRRETFADVHGLCTVIPTGRPFMKIVLSTVFPSGSLCWPIEARRRLRPVTLKLFTEIRPG